MRAGRGIGLPTHEFSTLNETLFTGRRPVPATIESGAVLRSVTPMPELETAAPVAGTTPDDLVEVGVYLSIAAGSQHGLVILAMRHPYWLEPGSDFIRLLVEPAIATTARHQLACFDRESAPPARTP